MAQTGNLNRLAEIEELAKEIEQIQAEVTEYESNLEVEKAGGLLAGYNATNVQDYNPPELKDEHQQNLSDLSILNKELEQMQNEQIMKTMPLVEIDTEEFLPDEGEAVELEPLQFSYNDLIQPYRKKYPKKSDAVIERLIKYENPDLYNTLSGKSEEKPKVESDMPESAQWGGGLRYLAGHGEGGFLTSTIRNTMHDHYKTFMYDIPAMEIKRAQMFPDDAGNDDRFRKVIRQNPKYKNYSDSQVEDLLKSVKNDGALVNNIAAEMLREGKEYLDNYHKDNPEMQAYIEWLNSKQDGYSRLGEGPGWDKFLTNLLITVGASRYESLLAGGISRFASKIVSIPVSHAVAGITSAAAVNVPDPSDIITGPTTYAATQQAVQRGIETGGEMLGQSLYGYGFEGAAHLANAVETLINEEVISPEKFQRILSEKRHAFQNVLINMPNTDKNIKKRKPTIGEVQNMLSDYMNTWYYKDSNGQMIRRGMEISDAAELATASYKFYATTASIIESFDVYARRIGLPFVGETAKAGLIGKHVNKLKDTIMDNSIISKYVNMRTINEGDSALKTAFKQGADVIFPKFAKTWSESVEEFLQANTEAVTEAYGPMGLEEYKWNVGEAMKDIWSVKTHVVEPILGGLLPGEFGGRVSNFSDMVLDRTGAYDKMNKKSITKRMNKGQGGMIVREGPVSNQYNLFIANPQLNDKGELIYNEEQIPSEGIKFGDETIAGTYTSYKEAKSVANKYNPLLSQSHDLKMATHNLQYYKSEPIVRKDGDDYVVEIVGEKGELIKKIGTFKNREDANRKVSNARENIATVTRTVEKVGLGEIEENQKEEVAETNKQIDKVETVDDKKSTNKIKYLDSAPDNVPGDKKHFKKGQTVNTRTAVAIFFGYMRRDKNNKPLEQTTEQQGIWEEIVKEGLHLDGEFLANNFKYHSHIFDDYFMDRDDFQKDIVEQFPELEETFDDIYKDEDYVDESEKEEEVSKVIEEYQDELIESDKKDEDAEYLEEQKDIDKDIVDVKDVQTDLDFGEKKAPEVEEEVVTIPGHIASDGKSEKVSRTTAENRLQELENEIIDEDVSGEQAAINEDEINALKRALKVKKKAPKKKAPEVKLEKAVGEELEELEEGSEPTLTPGEVVVYKGKEYIVRKVNKAGKVQMVDRETGKNFPGTPNVNTVKAGIAVKQLPTVIFNNYEYAIDEDGFQTPVYSLSTGKRIEDKTTKNKILNEFKKETTEEVIEPEIVEGGSTKISILNNRSKKLNYTKDQAKALMLLSSWLNERIPTNMKASLFLLSGYAGTGKTTLLENIIREAINIGYGNVVFGAIANRAVSVIKEKLAASGLNINKIRNIEDRTIASLLFGAPNKRGKFGLKDNLQFESPPSKTLYIWDEASMISDKAYNQMKDLLINEGGKIIFVGDNFQLPAVKSIFDIFKLPFFGDTNYALLSTVVRQALDNPVLKLATAMRMVGATKDGENMVILPNQSSPDGRVEVFPINKLVDTFIKSWIDGDGMVMIVHSNKNKRTYNLQARKSRYRSRAKAPAYVPGSGVKPEAKLEAIYPEEFVQAIGNTEVNNELKISNGDILVEGRDFDITSEVKEIPNLSFYVRGREIVTGKEDAKYGFIPSPVYFYADTSKLKEASTSEGSKIIVLLFPESPESAIHPSEESINIDTVPKELKDEVFDSDGVSTGKWALKSKVVTLTYGYAITAHKAQGSEWPEIAIAIPDYFAWAKNATRDLGDGKGSFTMNRWLYTALTRAQEKVYLSQLPKSDNPDIRIVSWEKIKEISDKALSDKQYRLTGKAKITSPANQAKVRKFTKMMFDKFEGKVPYRFVNDPNLTNKFGAPVGAFFDPVKNEVVINLALAETDAPFHEYMHPFISDIRNRNPVLYKNLLKEILGTKSGKKLLNDILEAYGEAGEIEVSGIIGELGEILEKIDGDMNDLSSEELYNLITKYDNKNRTISDELIAFTVGEAASKKVPNKSKWRKILDNIMEWVRHTLFGANWSVNVYARGLDVNTSLNDIARLLANSDRKFTLERVDKKLVKQNYDFKVDSQVKFLLFSKKKVELDVDKMTQGKTPLDDLKGAKATINRIFKEIWELSHYDKKKKTKKEDFAAMMVGDKANAILPEALHGHFNVWYRGQFNIRIEKGDNDYAVFDQSIHDKAAKFIGDNEDVLTELMGRLESNEKESSLASGSLLYIKEFGYTLEEQELKYIQRWARKLDFDDWIDVFYSDILKVKIKTIPAWRKRALTRFYNQIQSTLITNRGEEAQNVINYEVLIDVLGNFVISKKSKEKKFTAKGERKSNAGYQKKTLTDFNSETSNIFKWLSGKDIREQSINEYSNETQIKNLYGFLDEEQLAQLDVNMIENHGLAVAFSRGSSNKIALIDINDTRLKAKDKLNNLSEYIAGEVSGGYMTDAQAKKFIKNIKGMDSKKRQQAEIAVHEAIKLVWPKYLIDGENSANIYKRLKIPFTPVTVNEKMPDTRFFRFDPKEVLFQYKDNDPFSPMQRVKGKQREYIGDGETIGSSNEFTKYSLFHGLKPGTAIAKTVHYIKRGLNTFALKHQTFRAEPGLKILDKKTKEVLFEVSASGNIYLGQGHPKYVEPKVKIATGRETFAGKENYVGMLGTKTEIKIGAETDEKGNQIGIFKNTDELWIPGSAIGFIKYEEGMDKNARHPQQWYNHVQSEAIINHFKNYYLPQVEESIRKVMRVAVDTPQSSAPEKLAKLMEILDKKGDDTRIASFRELIKLGAGYHRQTSTIVDNFVYSSLITDSMKLGFGAGSTYNIAMDVTNTLGRDENGKPNGKSEIALYWKDPSLRKTLFAKYMEAKNIESMDNETIDDVNAWLANNVVNVMVTRFPVPHEGGAIMSRVKFLHEREAVTMMEINDVKHRLEGDNDGDHVQVEFLPEEIEKDYKEHLDNVKVKTLNLSKFIKEGSASIVIDAINRVSLIARLTAGENAIGEIANIQAAYGSIVKLYNKISSLNGGVKMRVRKPDEIIELPFYHKGGPWKGTVAEYLRLMLQAAVDNGKFGLLGEWGYSRQSVIDALIEYPENIKPQMKEKMFEEVVSPLFSLHKSANDIRNGQSFKDGIFGLKKAVAESKQYFAYTLDRMGTLRAMKIGVEVVEGASLMDTLSPIEMIALTPSRIVNEMLSNSKYPLLHRDGSPYIISIDLHGNAHRSGMNQLQDNKDVNLNKAAKKDKQAENLDFILEEITKGEIYAEEMAIKFETLIATYHGGEISAQSLDYNLEFIAFKEEYHDMFDGLSNVAKLAATYKFLEKPFEKTMVTINNKQVEIEGSSIGIHLPPVSDLYNQATLLDANLVKEYFKAFNKTVSETSNQAKYVKSQPRYASLFKIAEESCK